MAQMQAPEAQGSHTHFCPAHLWDLLRQSEDPWDLQPAPQETGHTSCPPERHGNPSQKLPQVLLLILSRPGPQPQGPLLLAQGAAPRSGTPRATAQQGRKASTPRITQVSSTSPCKFKALLELR